MSKATHSMEARLTLLARPLQIQWMLRLTLGYLALLGSVIFLLGTGWDIQWHTLIGRDRTLIPPHIMMLSGVAISGLAALLAIFTETVLVHRYTAIVRSSTHFADIFHSSLGAYIAGYAALNAAIAFPLDAYWHALYGIDVAIWAPFHIMFFVSMAIVALGATFMLVSAANVANDSGAHGVGRIGYIGGIIAFGTMMGLLTTLLFDPLSNSGMLIHISGISINTFFFLSGLAVAWTLVSTVVAIPWRWAATYAMFAYLVAALIIAEFVPPATSALVALEHQTFKNGNPGIALVTFAWPLAPILCAIALDILFHVVQRRGWSIRRRLLALASIALIGSVPITFSHPFFILTLYQSLGPTNLLVSLLLGLSGSLLGTWFGLHTGASMKHVERANNV